MIQTAPNLADCYKAGHPSQYRAGTTFLYSNLTPRSARLFRGSKEFDGKMVFFGLSAFCIEILIEGWNNTFFRQRKDKAILKYKRRMDGIFGKDVIPTKHMEKLHDLGYLPLRISALPEGSRVDMKVPVLTIENSHEDFAWLVNYIESVISSYLWKMCTNATIAYEYRRTFEKYAKLTGAVKEAIQFQGHDFSFRGMSGPEDAARCGAAHLLSFVGTDTIPAIDFLEDYYGADCENELVGCSVPATEHSVSSTNILFIQNQLERSGEFKGTERGAFGFDDRLLAEYCFLKELITEKYPTGIVSYVADTYDFWAVLTKILPVLKDEIMARDGKLVIRPDSGNPVHICAGYQQGEVFVDFNDEEMTILTRDGVKLETHEAKGAIQVLWELFGGTTTTEGYTQLDSHIGLIYGDSITLERQEEILSRLVERGFASDTIVFGVGSYTYQYVTRDSLGTAMKATCCIVDGEFIEVYKDPKTDNGTKKSARGLLRVEFEDGGYRLYDQQPVADYHDAGELKVVFCDGVMYNDDTIADIRKRLIG